METVLMVVTVVALALAIGMSALAWRLLREDRLRSDARVEVLRAMATDPERADPREPADQFLLLDDERRAQDEIDDSARRSAPALVEAHSSSGFSIGRSSLAWLALAALVVGLAGGVSATYAFYGPTAAGLPFGTARARPLELLSLIHEADADTFTVTGLVQNPRDGVDLRNVTAVVYLFDRSGNYFATGKAMLDVTDLDPGETSPFVVRIPNSGGVSRYRIGFQSETSGVIAHINRRSSSPAAEAPTPEPSTPAPAKESHSEGRP